MNWGKIERTSVTVLNKSSFRVKKLWPKIRSLSLDWSLYRDHSWIPVNHYHQRVWYNHQSSSLNLARIITIISSISVKPCWRLAFFIVDSPNVDYLFGPVGRCCLFVRPCLPQFPFYTASGGPKWKQKNINI